MHTVPLQVWYWMGAGEPKFRLRPKTLQQQATYVLYLPTSFALSFIFIYFLKAVLACDASRSWRVALRLRSRLDFMHSHWTYSTTTSHAFYHSLLPWLAHAAHGLYSRQPLDRYSSQPSDIRCSTTIGQAICLLREALVIGSSCALAPWNQAIMRYPARVHGCPGEMIIGPIECIDYILLERICEVQYMGGFPTFSFQMFGRYQLQARLVLAVRQSKQAIRALFFHIQLKLSLTPQLRYH